jgi:hypothetical protein
MTPKRSQQTASRAPRARRKPPAPPDYRAHPHLYEINTWTWLAELSEKHGRRISLGNVPESEWDALQRAGFDFVWLMGVWQRSPAGREIALNEPGLRAAYDRARPDWKPEQIVGSPYAVYAYQADPHLGAIDDLDRARDALHARGMKLILDFVPNHTALDHRWVRAHPDYYINGSEADLEQTPPAFFPVRKRGGKTFCLAHGRDPYFSPWTDTAQLNYFNPALRAALLKQLRALAAHCDGLRCDMAMLVLNDVFARTWGERLAAFTLPAEEFWTEATRALPGLIWMAEAYWDLEWRLQQLGFQFTYDKRLYDRLRHEAPAAVRLHLQADWNYQQRSIRFLENHDEERAAVAFGERLPAAATLAATLPGVRFYHHGQLEGRRRRLPIQLERAIDEPVDAEVRALYEKLLHFSNEEVFHQGEWRLLAAQPAGDDSYENLIAYRWRAEEIFKLVVVNLGGSSAQARLPLAEEVDPGKEYILLDQLNGESYPRAGTEMSDPGLYVRLDAGRAHLFDLRPS